MSILNAFLAAAGGGLEYETGTFTPTSSITSQTVNFSKTHTKPPAILFAFDVSGRASSNNDKYSQVTIFLAIDVYSITHVLWTPYMGTPNRKGYVMCEEATSDSGSTTHARALQYGASDTSQTGTNATRYYLREASATINYSPYYLRPNVKMRWLAIWLPDSWTPPA